MCKGEIDLTAIEQQASEAAACAGVPESFAVVPGGEDIAEQKRQRVL